MKSLDYVMPEAEYFAAEAASNSTLGRMRRSPAHCKEYMDNPPDSTAAMKLGTLFHTLVLEPEAFVERFHVAKATDPVAPRKAVVKDMIAAIRSDEFTELFVVNDAPAPRKPAGKTLDFAELVMAHGAEHESVKAAATSMKDEQVDRALGYANHLVKMSGRTEVKREDYWTAANYAAYLNAIDGKAVVSEDDLGKARAMAESVKAHPVAAQLLAGGKPEVSCFWDDEETGAQCKCRIDWISDAGYLTDLKSSADASEPEFSRSIAKFGYHRQQAMYTDGYTQASGLTPKGFIFIVTESAPPHATGVYALDMEGEEVGRREYQEFLASFTECQKNDVWPAYSESVEQIELPRWYK